MAHNNVNFTFFFQANVHQLTDQCWDACMDKPSTKLDSRTQNCITYCVDRFLDATNFIVNRMEKSAGISGLAELE